MMKWKYVFIISSFNNDHGDYHGKTYLRNCIESVLNQTYKNFELVIVDDMSTDSSVETIKSYNDDRIHLIENKRKRYNGGSRNVGIEYALDNLEFDYFGFLDSDDWWKNDHVLEDLNNCMTRPYEMILFGIECINKLGVFLTKIQEYKDYKEFFMHDNKTWCTCWSKFIRKDKIVYFCENTLMEDRVWSYRLADGIDIENVYNYKEVCYVWNRMNTTTSVSQQRNYYWNASAYCHIGHQLQFMGELKHKEMLPYLQDKVIECIRRVDRGEYVQF